MKIYNVEETRVGNFFKINYLLARQLMIIFDTYKQRILDASIEEIENSIIEKAYHFENSVSYSYSEVPSGWKYIINKSPKVETIFDFINWFMLNKQQPIDYLIYGVIKRRSEKRGKIKEDNTYSTTDYVPVEIEDNKGKMIKRSFNRF